MKLKCHLVIFLSHVHQVVFDGDEGSEQVCHLRGELHECDLCSVLTLYFTTVGTLNRLCVTNKALLKKAKIAICFMINS